MSKHYTIGLDIGTNSVGWAVIDEDFNLVKGKKKIREKGQTRKVRTNLWGARLFEEGHDAADRRLKRGMRRRIERRRKRIEYLRKEFEKDILAFDDSFFIRLDETFIQNDDEQKKVQTPYPLFNGIKAAGESYATDREYLEKYPTIYHLRQRLVEDGSQADLRLVYLALHHIAKFRGHFTNQGQKFDLSNINVSDSLWEVLLKFDELTPFSFNFDDEKHDAADKILTNPRWSKSKKAYELTEFFKASEISQNFDQYSKKELEAKDKQLKALFTALVGNSIDLAKIFENEDYKPSDDYPKASELKYGNEDFDDKLESLSISDEERELLSNGKKVYEATVLSGILTQETLAASMVEKYELHRQQLKALKIFTKSISEDLFKQFFKEEGIYTRFIEGTGNPAKRTSRDDFYKEIKKAFEIEFKGLKFPDVDKAFDFSKLELSSEQEEFLTSLSDATKFDSYLPKQRQSDNGAIPYQVHEYELVKILENQGQYYPFLKEKVTLEDENEEGETLKKEEYKIQALFKFRIPYYVGTLAKEAGWVRDEDGKLVQTSSLAKNAWLVRNSDEKLTPWNFSQVVNKEESAVNFIERMTNFDTYLPDEKVLPKNSLLYQEFTIYNELISSGYYQKGKAVWFDAKTRQNIVNDLFKKNKKVSASKMLTYLNQELLLNLTSPKELFGIDTFVKAPSFNTSYSTFIDLKNAGIDEELIEANKDKFEQIIKWQTIFEDKKILKKTIRNANKDWQILTDEQINKLAKKHYTGWGRLSKKLLDELQAENGKTIIDNLKTENFRNFMRLLEDEKIAAAIKAAQIDKLNPHKLSYGVVKDLAGSPALKKGIWQSLKIIQELESYLGRENISKIVIEMPRENAAGRTTTRQKQIENFYKKFTEKTGEAISSDLRHEFEQQDQHRFDDEKVFLYFLQNGKSMYGGAELDLDKLSDYEVDHIVPQTYIKDDSFDNKVLVLKSENQNKGGDVPSQAIIDRMSSYWELLAKNGQVSSRKLSNLKMGHLSDERKSGFIHRQLVETRQITKHVATILSDYFKDSSIEILTPKAGLTSQFRHGEVFIPKSEFNFEEAVQQKLHFEWEQQEFLSNGEIQASKFKDSNFVKLYVHEGFLKNRDLNDYHHAHDAYLNSVIANYIYETRPDLRKMWVYGDYKRKAAREVGKWGKQRRDYFKQLLTDMKDELWLKYAVDEDGKTLYSTGEFWKRDEILDKIKRNLSLRNVNVVKKCEIVKGDFSDAFPKKRGTVSENAISNKANLSVRRYGGKTLKDSSISYAVIVRLENGEIKALPIKATQRENFEKALNKVEVLNSIFERLTISEVLVEKIRKYNKYQLPNGGMRLVASYQEAQVGTELPMMKLPSKNSTDSELKACNETLSQFIIKNKLFAEKKIDLLDSKIKEAYELGTIDEKLAIINDMLTVASASKSSQGLKALSKAGLGTTAQQLKSGNVITNDTTLIHQSPTGLYESRIKLGEDDIIETKEAEDD